MKFKGEVDQFMVMQLAIARIYPGWLLRKMSEKEYRILAHGQLMYQCETLTDVSRITGIGLITAMDSHKNYRAGK